LGEINGSQLNGQYFDASGRAVGDPFVVAGNLAVAADVLKTTYTIRPVTGGFIAVYQATTSGGQQIFESRFTAPSLS
jgi:hypothetical protein